MLGPTQEAQLAAYYDELFTLYLKLRTQAAGQGGKGEENAGGAPGLGC
jgi:hypothetical protein